MPTEIDQSERQIMQNEMERQALKKEKDPASKERLAKLEGNLRICVNRVASSRRSGRAKRRRSISRASSRRSWNSFASSSSRRSGGASYRRLVKSVWAHPGSHPPAGDAQSKLGEIQGGQQMLKEEVTEEDIAEVGLRVDRASR
jgi:ATP-dependent Clp protease ATP-binding subunit ClpB